MKKILSIFAAAAVLFGFASCSGDLHDLEEAKHEPVTIAGASWYYLDIAVWGDSDGTSEGLIVNGASGQSANATLPEWTAKDGGVAYYTVSTADKDVDNPSQYVVRTSYQKDEPAYTLVPGTVRIYVYTDETGPNLYYWGGDFKGPDWPGLAMTKIGAKDPSIFIDGCKVIGITDSIAKDGTPIYFMEGWVPGNTWSTAGTCIGVVISGNAVYTFTEPVESLTAALKVQVRALNTVTDLWDGSNNKINSEGDFTSSADGIELDGSHYYWVLDCSDYKAKLVAVD